MQWLLITCSHARAYACMDKSYKHFTVTSVTVSPQTTLFQQITNSKTVLNNFYTSYASVFQHLLCRKLCCHLFICSIFTPLYNNTNHVRWQMWQQKTLNHWVIRARTFRAHVRDSLAYSLPCSLLRIDYSVSHRRVLPPCATEKKIRSTRISQILLCILTTQQRKKCSFWSFFHSLSSFGGL